MSLNLHIIRFCGLAVSVLVLGAQAHAEGNRLLPFWGQPYPYGFARVDPAPSPLGLAPCQDRRGARPTRGYRHGGGSERCQVVLHARD